MRGEHLWFLNTWVTIRVSSHDGHDGISIIEGRAPFGDSAPLHIHHTEDEVFHVLEGELRFQVGDRQIRCGPGEIKLAPKDVPHTYRVESREGARWLTITANSDFERFVRAMSRPAERLELPPTIAPTPEAIEALTRTAREYGIELIGPPLT